MLVEIRAEVQAADHIVCRDLDRALADLAVSHLFGGLEDQNRQIRTGTDELTREEAAGDPRPGDDDVVVLHEDALHQRRPRRNQRPRASARFTIRGVRKMTSSLRVSLARRRWKRMPRIGMSPSTG